MDGEVPWEEIERLYVQGELVDGRRVLLSIVEVARRCNLSRKSVSQRANAGDWAEKRASFTGELATEVRKKVADVVARHLSERVNRRAELGARVLDDVRKMLDANDNVEAGKEGTAKLSPLDLQRLQAVIKTQAETDRIDLALDPPAPGGEKSDDGEEDAELEAVLAEMADELVNRNQSPEGGEPVEREA